MTFCYAMCTIFSYCDELEKRPISFGLDMNIEPQKDPSKQNRLINADSSHLLDARVAPSVNPALSQKKSAVASKSPLKGLIFYGHPSTENK